MAALMPTQPGDDGSTATDSNAGIQKPGGPQSTTPDPQPQAQVEASPPVVAEGPYRVWVGDEVRRVRVSEEAVLTGRVVEVGATTP